MSGFSYRSRPSVTGTSAGTADARYISGPSRGRPMRDALGLFETSAFEELAADRLDRSLAKGGRVAVAVFDLGERATEASLRLIASAIVENVRPSDLAARTSPTTFVALLDRCEREEAKQVCGRILRSLTTAAIDGRLSCGIAVASTDGSSLAALIARAAPRPVPARAGERLAAAAS